MNESGFFDLHPERCQVELQVHCEHQMRCTARADDEGHEHRWDSAEQEEWARGHLLGIIVQPRRAEP